MIYTLSAPSSIRLSVQLPASKSISNRVLILNALSKNPYPVENLSDSDDTRVMLNAFEANRPLIDIGAAGTSMRFLTAYLSQLPGEYILTGTERMKNRPVRILTEALRQLGAKIEYLEKEGYPPLKIKGKALEGGIIHLNGSVSSQFISALMMIAPCLEKGLTIHLEGEIISRPYVAMTIRLMEDFGIKTEWIDSTIRIQPQAYRARPFQVESDWSAASYWYEIAALSETDTEVELLGLHSNSVQGDSEVAGLFEKLGVATLRDSPESGIRLKKQPEIVSGVFHRDFIAVPDLAQTLVVTCCMMNIPFRFTGLQSLRIKETDRISALQQEMRKLGYVIKSESDSVVEWLGEKCPAESDPVISTYEDHRMAMAFAPVCLKNRSIKIKDPEVVSKSYPHFWDDLKQAGFIIQYKI
jgi:3-phosphoshikimate 1-carboxyvinyltransferase